MGLRLPSLLILWVALCYAGELKRGRDPNHGHYVCSTWGNNHFKTFDGDFYQFPGLCDYNFASDCQESYKEFSVHIQRQLNDQNHPGIHNILVTLKDVAIYFNNKMVVVDGQIVRTPYYSSGIHIKKNNIYTEIHTREGIDLLWNGEDALMLELDARFNNKTCGLCGDYNGQPIYNEFLSNGLKYDAITFGNLQKINKPNEECEDPDETQTVDPCNQHREECEALLTSPAFTDCQSRLNLEQYIQACMQDKCACQQAEDSFCLCSTISEFSRQCSHSGGKPQNWRSSQFCPKSCPGNMIYMESGSPCMDSCSHLEISSLCEEHYMDGCFCPEGTVYDDITGKGCVATNQCSCKLHGNLFSPGQNITNECESCTCQSGRWICQDLPCPGTCALEGGAHITTFDGKKYTFHGDCYYVLTKLQSSKNETNVLLGELGPCGSTGKQTCLKMVVLLVDNKQNIVVFKPDGTVLLNENEVHLPHVSASFSVFQPSSYHIIVETNLGLKLQIQIVPIMQLFTIADQSVKGIVQGLCGNFNGIEGDDFKTSGGMVEATGAAFANTWKAQTSCTDKVDTLEHPCTLNLENENYAEHWCSLLKSSESPFARCHSAIDPADYYKRCKYDTCSCNANEECLCAALSSYARACAFKGIMLWGWRNIVCNKEVSSCPATQVFRYNLTVCQQTCRSLSEGDKHCLQGFIPVDGCGCPDNSYLNDKGVCVPADKCPCYYKGSFTEPGNSIIKQEEHCVCRHGKFHCTPVISNHDCFPNKTYFDCNNSSQTPVQLSCQTLGTAHFQTECVSGCICPDGLIDDGRGGCVKEEDCPCIHNKEFFAPGEKIDVDCNECTCQNGAWACTKFVCHGTCIIYGSGHYITFDGKYYDFDGKCEYVASQDYCGLGNHHGSFSIITENVPCGSTGVTCSKAIKVFLGRTELKLEDKQKVVITRDLGHHVKYWTRNIGLYLVIEASNGVVLIWDKKTTIFIKLTPNYKGKVCGLCGNFDDKAYNDFTTRSQVQVANALDFGNSWKRDSACPDVTVDIEPCDQTPHRKSWAEKECSLIKSEVFEICHPKVDPEPFYEACVHDACACDSGGDCECFCTAVAAYAQECIKAEACVFWRTPDICPIFCDYYNPTDICEWHYEPCGRDIMTCKMLNNISTNISVPYLEGCYPRCHPETPIFNEETYTCVTEDLCGCYVDDIYYETGSMVPTDQPCEECICIGAGRVICGLKIDCCVYNGTEYDKGDSIVERNGSFCFNLTCENGTMIHTNLSFCEPTTTPSTTTVSITTVSTIPSSTSSAITTISTSATTSCYEYCQWSQWYDVSFPKDEPGGGDYETYEAIRNKYGNNFCSAPQNIECRAKDSPEQNLEELGQKVECNVTYGLICRNEDQDKSLWNLCYNYEIRVNCCDTYCGPLTTSTTTLSTTTRKPTTTTTATPSTTTPTTTTTATPSTTTPTTTATPSTTTPTTTTTATPSTTTPTTTSTSTPTTTTTTQTTSASTTPCTPGPEICEWSDWIDVSYPLYGPEGGDYETYDNIRTHGIDVCTNPLNISCRAVKFPEFSFKELGQKVECDVSTGLVCNNKDQVPGPLLPAAVCLNYEISIYCCSITCAPITTPSTTTATPETTTSTTTSLSTTTTTPTPSTSSTTLETTTACPPGPEICEWSDWIDVSYPVYSPEGGDYETYDNIRTHGIDVCTSPLNISCRAVKFPDFSFKELGQKVECDVSTGLVCNNKDQVPGPSVPLSVCLNYEISIYCCSITCAPTTTPSTTTTTPETTTSTTTSLSTTTTTATPSPTSTTLETTTAITTTIPCTTEETESWTPETSTVNTTTVSLKTTTPTKYSSTTETLPTTTTTTSTQTPSTTTSSPTTTTTIETTTTTLPTSTPTEIPTTSTTPETPSTTTSTTPTTTTSTQTPSTTTSSPTTTTTTTIETTTTPLPTSTPTEIPTTTSTTTPETPSTTTSTTPTTTTSTQTPSTSTSSPTTTTTIETTTTTLLTSTPTEIPTTSTSPEIPSTTTSTTPTTTTSTQTPSTTTSSPTTTITIQTTTTPLPTSTPTEIPPTTSTTTPETPSTTTSTTPTTTTSTPTPSTTTSSPTTTTTIETTTTTLPTSTPTEIPTTSTTPETPSTTTSTTPTTTTSAPTPSTTTSSPTTTTTIETTTTLPTSTPTEIPTTSTTPETPSTTTSTTPTTTTSTQTPSTTTSSPTTTTTIETTTTTLPTSTPTEIPTTSTTPETPSTTTSTTPTTTTSTTPSTTTSSPTTTTTIETTTTTLPTSTPTEIPTTSTTPETPSTTTSTTPTTTTSTQTPSTTTSSPTTTTTMPTSTPTEIPPTTSTTPETPSTTTSTTPTTTPTQTPSTTTSSPTTTTTIETTTTTLPTSTPTEIPTTTTPETPSTTTSTSPTTTTSTQTPSTTTIETTTTSLPTSTLTETTTTSTSLTTPGTPSTTTTTTTPGTPTTTTSSPTTTITIETTTTPLPTSTPTEIPTTTSTTTPETPSTTTSTTPTTTPTQTPSTTTSSPTTTTTIETTTTTLPTSTPTEIPTTTTPEIPSTTTSTTSTTTTSTPTPTTTSTTTIPSTTSPTISTSTPCHCEFAGKIYMPGETVDTGSHGDTCFLANCSSWCQIEFFYWVCPSTTSTVSPSTMLPNATTSPPSTPQVKPCLNGTVQPGDSWWICNCTQAICVENDTWVVVPVECIPPPEPQCSNGLAPVRVIDDDGCCWHWECDCYCTGWGDPHYYTFDGTYYSYQGNCTYTLVEEINKRVDNFGVYIDNYHCDPREPVSCPRTLFVRHETQEVRITTVREVPMKVQVLVNGQTVALPYQKYGLKVYESGVNQVVEIPELKMNVTYNGMAFTIRLPYKLFGNNTQGQCGTCTNNTADDCMLRNGSLASRCEVMADDWIVNDPSKPQCLPLLPPPTVPTASPCKPSLLCELLKSVFEKCHETVDPHHYYEACSFDSCRIPGRNIECATLQIYAATCADQGVCIDWRKDTNGLCPIHCPSNKIYKACGPSAEETCKSGSLSGTNETQVEGCFCPEGTKLYDSGVDVCVKTCGCVGPDNIPRAFGETFQFDCKDCVCLEGGAGIICENHKCPLEVDELQCEGEGFHKISEVNPDDKCCSKTTCVCNITDCTIRPPTCVLGFEAVSHTPSGHCCPAYQCAPKGVCVHNGAEYTPGSKVLGGQCQDCVCTHQWNNSTQLNVIDCDHVPCSLTCEAGYSLISQPGECCGKCVQTSCLIRTNDYVFTLAPGEHRNDPKDNCTIYSCVKSYRQLISSTSTINCPPFNENRCQPDTITYLPNGCCQTCIPKEPQTPPPCSLIVSNDYISYNGCRSVEQVSVNQCEGTCGTYSVYSAEANSMDHKCTCCREEKTTKKPVTLECPDGTNQTHFYLHVESCKCLDTECNEAASSEQSSVKRRRRHLTRK
ncbi:mucin-2-like [Paroedura picta]|uniref:mucin-2-like n=1 Tax=Paroedura picta TaxID=143630 RepID=UPI0040565DED